MNKKQKFITFLGVSGLGVLCGYNLVAYAYSVPGWTEPYNPAAYYSLTEISFEDSPSPFALKDLARNGGTVYDYTRHIKSILAGDNFEKTAEIAVSKTENEEINIKPFTEEIFLETGSALNIVEIGTEKVSKVAVIDESNGKLRQGNDDDWESYNSADYNTQDKYRWLDEVYKDFVSGSRQEIAETENVIRTAEKILNHTNIAEGNLQMYQAQNELKTLLAYELARQNALDANFAQLQAVYQSSEYDEIVEAAYIDSITKFDVVDPYDEVDYKMLKEEYNYEKPTVKGMPDFK